VERQGDTFSASVHDRLPLLILRSAVFLLLRAQLLAIPSVLRDDQVLLLSDVACTAWVR